MDMFAEIMGPVLCIAAHPEDLEIHAGGTIARLVQAEVAVSYVLCTSGNRGTSDLNTTMEAVGKRREAEQRQAMQTLGVEDIIFLRHDDGDLQYVAGQLREELVRLIRQKRPRSIITHDPFPGDGSHDSCAIYPDHLTVGRVVFESAFVCAPSPLFYPEQIQKGLATWKPEVLYLTMSQTPEMFVEIAPIWQQKIEAVQTFESQGRHLPEVKEFFLGIAENLAQRANLCLAEGFRRLLPS